MTVAEIAAMTINTIYGEIVLIYEYSMEEF